jgi:hypothetical protein
MTDDSGLLAAAIQTLRMLESYGSGRLARTQSAVDLREAIIKEQGFYETVAEALERERAELMERLRKEATND